MKYLASREQLQELLKITKSVMIVFVDPNEFMPAKALLNYIHGHKITQKVDGLIYIWNIVDTEIYDKYSVSVFPQVSILKGENSMFSFIGYNREKANDALAYLCLAAELGRVSKELIKKL